MLSELKKSTNAILFERVTSPLYGTILISWLIWNWKIVYLTFFVSENRLLSTKIEYIIINYYDIDNLVTFPLISAVLLLTIIPFTSNGAFWISLIFKKWKTDKKNEIEKKQLLTIEQSVSLRKEIREKEIEFEKILEKRTLEEVLLNSQIKELEQKLSDIKSTDEIINNSDDITVNRRYGTREYRDIRNNEKIFKSFGKIISSIRDKSEFPRNTPSKLKEYYLLNDIVEKYHDDHENRYYYKLTAKGILFYKEFFNESFESNE